MLFALAARFSDSQLQKFSHQPERKDTNSLCKGLSIFMIFGDTDALTMASGMQCSYSSVPALAGSCAPAPRLLSRPCEGCTGWWASGKALVFLPGGWFSSRDQRELLELWEHGTACMAAAVPPAERAPSCLSFPPLAPC